MANRKAKIKTIEVNAQRRARNRQLKSALHTQIKKLSAAIDQGDKETAQKELKSSIINIDKNCTKGILHKNTAARTKSRLSARVAKLA